MTTYTCAHCPATFDSVTEHMVHVGEQHPPGAQPPWVRPMSCWRCATWIVVATGQCSNCGWRIPERLTAAAAPAPADTAAGATPLPTALDGSA